MASYNGNQYIGAQIRSILDQSINKWVLLIRDDGSSDGTQKTLEELARQDDRIKIITSIPQRRLGPKESFGLLMQYAHDMGADYIWFADQDDVWNPDKMELQLRAITKLEEQGGRHLPALVYSDLEIVDQSLNTIHPSFYQYQNIRGDTEPSLLTLLAQNHVVGCTVLLNRLLLDIALPLPQESYMHDWWVALCARATGVVEFLPQPTIKYRQHHGNQVGAGGLRRLLKPNHWTKLLRKMNRLFRYSHAQAPVLRQRIAMQKSVTASHQTEAIKTINIFSQLTKQHLARRIRTAITNRMHSQNLALTILLYFQLILTPLIYRNKNRP